MGTSYFESMLWGELFIWRVDEKRVERCKNEKQRKV